MGDMGKIWLVQILLLDATVFLGMGCYKGKRLRNIHFTNVKDNKKYNKPCYLQYFRTAKISEKIDYAKNNEKKHLIG